MEGEADVVVVVAVVMVATMALVVAKSGEWNSESSGVNRAAHLPWFCINNNGSDKIMLFIVDDVMMMLNVDVVSVRCLKRATVVRSGRLTTCPYYP